MASNYEKVIKSIVEKDSTCPLSLNQPSRTGPLSLNLDEDIKLEPWDLALSWTKAEPRSMTGVMEIDDGAMEIDDEAEPSTSTAEQCKTAGPSVDLRSTSGKVGPAALTLGPSAGPSGSLQTDHPHIGEHLGLTPEVSHLPVPRLLASVLDPAMGLNHMAACINIPGLFTWFISQFALLSHLQATPSQFWQQYSWQIPGRQHFLMHHAY